MSNTIRIILFVCFFTITFIELSSSEIRQTPATTTKTTDSKSLWIENRIPKPPSGCKNVFICKKKLKHSFANQTIKPCIKYCVRSFSCPDDFVGKTDPIDPDWCVLLDQNQLEDFETAAPPARSDGKTNIVQVNMIDFPCQEGYLPDFRGRCREVW
ncbi:uncharacterized protein LOC129942120 [Eupeodes corollae]|uniref:uncharacterized protein LOC129942120 n=1 Tax=Eupeodes corollae TaxID=290404 RepID=UPI002492F793|nr:uncharacterized protein LOC129942120 [Eupeodes corollae]